MDSIESEEYVVMLGKTGGELPNCLHAGAERGTNLYLELINEHGDGVELIVLVLTLHGEVCGMK